MRKHIDKLHLISQKKERKIIGLMSGTSLDGLDVAICSIKGTGITTELRLGNFKTVSYNDDIKNEIRSVFAKRDTDLEKICLLNGWIADQHASIINECLKEWKIVPEDIDLIASHGQTIYHAPLHQHTQAKFGNGTLQIGDGDRIAVKTGIITISDFRQKHIAAGGEGAPLAAYGDLILFGNRAKDTILLNIGGIANFTFLPARNSGQTFFSTDIGPGNTLMDAWMMKCDPEKDYDRDAEFAAKGKCNEQLLNALLAHPFLKLSFPKTTGPESFNLSFVEEALNNLNTSLPPEDIMATLNALTVTTICDGIKKVTGLSQMTDIFISGGGMRNPLVVEGIKNKLNGFPIRSTNELNIDPDAKEAILFAILANETVAGTNITGYGLPEVSMGKVSFPS